jgi:hypothetical protein
MFGLHAAIIVYLGNRFCSVIVSVLVSSAVDNGFEARTGQTKEYNKLRKNLKQQFYNSFVNKINELHPNYSIKAFGNH